MTKYEQKELLIKISENLCGIFDGIADEFDEDSETYKAIAEVEEDISILLESFDEEDDGEPKNYYDYEIPAEFGENEQRRRESNSPEGLMRTVSQVIAFSDCSDERVTKIVYKGVEVHYTGWQPDNIMEYADANGNIVWSGCFPEWNH